MKYVQKRMIEETDIDFEVVLNLDDSGVVQFLKNERHCIYLNMNLKEDDFKFVFEHEIGHIKYKPEEIQTSKYKLIFILFSFLFIMATYFTKLPNGLNYWFGSYFFLK